MEFLFLAYFAVGLRKRQKHLLFLTFCGIMKKI
jgi:hypothetical protein